MEEHEKAEGKFTQKKARALLEAAKIEVTRENIKTCCFFYDCNLLEEDGLCWQALEAIRSPGGLTKLEIDKEDEKLILAIAAITPEKKPPSPVAARPQLSTQKFIIAPTKTPKPIVENKKVVNSAKTPKVSSVKTADLSFQMAATELIAALKKEPVAKSFVENDKAMSTLQEISATGTAALKNLKALTDSLFKYSRPEDRSQPTLSSSASYSLSQQVSDFLTLLVRNTPKAPAVTAGRGFFASLPMPAPPSATAIAEIPIPPSLVEQQRVQVLNNELENHSSRVDLLL